MDHSVGVARVCSKMVKRQPSVQDCDQGGVLLNDPDSSLLWCMVLAGPYTPAWRAGGTGGGARVVPACNQSSGIGLPGHQTSRLSSSESRVRCTINSIPINFSK